VIRQGPGSLASNDGSYNTGSGSELNESGSSGNSCLASKFRYSPRFVRRNEEERDIELGQDDRDLQDAIARSLESGGYEDYSEFENQDKGLQKALQDSLETANKPGWKGKNKID
jgi:hypothetical protein